MNQKNLHHLYDRLFDTYAKVFRYGITIFGAIVLRFLIMEFLILEMLPYQEKSTILFVFFLRLLFLISVMLYTSSHIACRSYVNSKYQQYGGSRRYRFRAVSNYLWGLIVFVIVLALILSTYFL